MGLFVDKYVIFYYYKLLKTNLFLILKNNNIIKMRKRFFVFATCGDDKQIDQLNFSLKYLKHFSKYEIIIVTDLKRNKKEIFHDNIIDITTPEKYDNNRASLFLKTSLHKILDMSNEYCYLDACVIAIKKEINKIFNHNYGKITFSPDFIKINEISPNLINCNCLINNAEEKKQLGDLLIRFKDYHSQSIPLKEYLGKEKKILKRIRIKFKVYTQIKIKKILLKYTQESKEYNLNNKKTPFFKRIKIKLFDKLNINEDWIFNTYNNAWFDEKGEIIYSEHLNFLDHISKISNFKFDAESDKWVNKKGNPVYIKPTCNHLIEKIKTDFNVNISKDNWQHWNTNVFIFTSESAGFMNIWHEYTLKILEDKNWEVSDIGTLAATVWKLKLQKQEKLPTEFNLVANYQANNVLYNGNGEYALNKGDTIIYPYFINFCNGFGNKEWNVWNSIEKLLLEK